MVDIYILHAGIGHPSPFFYNFSKSLEKFKDLNIIISPELPKGKPKNKSVLYFHRLKRYYNSNSRISIDKFLEKVQFLKNNGWKIIWTIHNFYPIDGNVNENDNYLLKEFIKLPNLIFTFSEIMKYRVKKEYNRNSINHSFGFNKLDSWFDKKIVANNFFSKKPFVFTFIGNFSRYKLLEQIINTFKKVNNKNTYLLLAGPISKFYTLDKNLYENEKNIIVKNTFIGKSDWELIAKNTNVFINLYDLNFEAFKKGFVPSNCIEIQKHKKISISPQCKEIQEILPTGYVIEYDYNDDNGLVKAMKYAISNKEYIKKLEKSFPEKDYDWNYSTQIVAESVRNLF